MSFSLRQTDRLGRLTTALGPDTLVLLRFDGSDHLNGLFDYRVEAISMERDLDFDALVGTHATVAIDGREGCAISTASSPKRAGSARTRTATATT
ncbi:hypothetical protein QWZ10_07285 [Paracoccus cavernae]|uniref:Uncharacterized protein n=1 Tax=Paracoccus cavernae TaxID=1571207 RepID=A0ABT8D8E6_9RHOB|nr:hypothetical protein [Paracoccus cavernae]